MTGPTGLIFAMKSRYKTTRAGADATADTNRGTEALFNEALTGFSGDSATGNDPDGDGVGTSTRGSSGLVGATDTNSNSDISDSGSSYTPDYAKGYSTADAEALGNTGDAFAEMGFSIEKATVTARSRALKAEYTLNLHKT